MKYYKIDGLKGYYVKAAHKFHAVYLCFKHRVGITQDDLIEIERIPSNYERLIQ